MSDPGYSRCVNLALFVVSCFSLPSAAGRTGRVTPNGALQTGDLVRHFRSLKKRDRWVHPTVSGYTQLTTQISRSGYRVGEV
jgi:hypothetical protein